MRHLAVGLRLVALDADGARDLEIGGDAADAIRAAGMHRVEVAQHPPHALGQRVIGVVHVGEQRVAAMVRHLARIEHGAQRRLLEEAEVRMPGIAEGADVALVGFLQHGDDVRILVHVLDVGRAAERAEPAREGEMLLRRQALVMEEQHQPIVKGALDLRRRSRRRAAGRGPRPECRRQARRPSAGPRCGCRRWSWPDCRRLRGREEGTAMGNFAGRT